MSRDTKGPLIAAIQAGLRAIDADIDRIDELAAARLGINRTDFRCLDILSRGQAITAGKLAAEAGLTTGAVTALVDRMEKAGYVRRKRDGRDRRVVLIEATPRTAEQVWPLFAGLVAASTAVLRQFHVEELETIVRFLEMSGGAIRKHLSNLQTPEAPGAD